MKQLTRDELKPFQTRAAGALAGMIQDYPSTRFRARFDPDSGEILPFLCRLHAITGAGKTPILASAAQYLETGIVLWTTNRGAVVSQTLANLRGGKYSALLPEGTQIYMLGEMSSADWEAEMQATTGLTILLATVASFNQDGDVLKIHRPIYEGGPTRWQMLNGRETDSHNRPRYVFYDEGHGATEQQFRKLRELEPRAFVLASASPLPEDFSDLISGKNDDERKQSLIDRTVIVPTTEVVEAGLLKNHLYFVDCNTASTDAVREAQTKWLDLRGRLAPVGLTPIASFIVNDTTRGIDIWEQLVALGVNRTQIAVHLNGAKDVMAERHGALLGMIDTYTGKKAAERSPEALWTAGYTHLIWNKTLREGWDEPLAYVAYLDNRGLSTVDIVQKIGRFVRQPGATPFDDPDLNSAYFYFNITDEAFTKLIAETQSAMETVGYEVIATSDGQLPPPSRSVPVKEQVTLPSIAPWFGDKLADLDAVILNEVPLFNEKYTKAPGLIQTRVFNMEQMKEDKARRTANKRESNDATTAWQYIGARLAESDSRIVGEGRSIFSSKLKDDEKMSQKVEYGSEAMTDLAAAVERIKQGLNDKLQLTWPSRRAVYEVPSFKLTAPDLAGSGVTPLRREKYRVRSYTNALHAEYNGLNSFEVKVADALDSLGKPWCRNPVKVGYKIPLPRLGTKNISFYPDFLLWTGKEVWAIDPKGDHLVDAAVAQKLLDLSGVKGLKPLIRIAFVLEGHWQQNAAGVWEPSGAKSGGFTFIRKGSSGPKGQPFSNLVALVKTLVRP